MLKLLYKREKGKRMSKQMKSLALGLLLVPGALCAAEQQGNNRWPAYEELIGNMPVPLQEKYAKLSDEQRAAIFALYQDVSRLMVIADDIKERHKGALDILHELGLHGKVSYSIGTDDKE